MGDSHQCNPKYMLEIKLMVTKVDNLNLQKVLLNTFS